MFFKKNKNEIKKALPGLYPRLWRFCISLTGNRDQADDLAQVTCLRAIDKADQFQLGTRLDSWLFTIAHRTWINELRSQAVRRGNGILQVEELDIVDEKVGSESNYFAREVLSEIQNLPEAQRYCVNLAYIEGYSYKETAEILEIPIGTVMSRLSAARAKLGKIFHEGGSV